MYYTIRGLQIWHTIIIYTYTTALRFCKNCLFTTISRFYIFQIIFYVATILFFRTFFGGETYVRQRKVSFMLFISGKKLEFLKCSY